MARGRVCNFNVVVSTRFGRLGRRFEYVCRANADFCDRWDRFCLWGVVVRVCGVRVWCLMPNCLHTFLSAIMLTQCCCLLFCRCLFVVRVEFVYVSVGDTDGVCLVALVCRGTLCVLVRVFLFVADTALLVRRFV